MNNRRTTAVIAVVVAVLAFAAAAVAPAGSQPSEQPDRKLFVVGDSIVLGAKDNIEAAAPPGWTAEVNAQASRGTDVGLDVVRANKAAISDVLVLGLGANDGGTPSIFGPRVEALLSEVADVPHVFWIEIAEVREYYPGANAVVREVAARYDNVSVIAWSDRSIRNPDLTADDGLHLTRRGRQVLAKLVLDAATATPPPAEADGAPALVEIDDLEPRLVFAKPRAALVELLRTTVSARHSFRPPSYFR